MRVDVLDLIRLERQIVEAARELAAGARRRLIRGEGIDEQAVAALMQAKALLASAAEQGRRAA